MIAYGPSDYQSRPESHTTTRPLDPCVPYLCCSICCAGLMGQSLLLVQTRPQGLTEEVIV